VHEAAHGSARVGHRGRGGGEAGEQVVDDRPPQRLLRAEVVRDERLRDAGGARDRAGARTVEAAGREFPAGGFEDPPTGVRRGRAGRVGARGARAGAGVPVGVAVGVVVGF
jgi:hypothetical protein